MTTCVEQDLDDLRDAIKHFIDHDRSHRRVKDKTSLINYCTAALIYFTQEGFSRDEIRNEVIAIVG